MAGNGWRALQSIVNTARREREEDDARAPIACPHDGEPLKTNINGIAFCPYDGWKPDGRTGI
jgi:hypothetical protein